jgi:cytoskeletal protein CcmA (bactofilin family)
MNYPKQVINNSRLSDNNDELNDQNLEGVLLLRDASDRPAEDIRSLRVPPRRAPIHHISRRKAMETRFQPRSLSAREETTRIGKCVVIRGELSGDEDLIIEGQVEGKIILKDHCTVIGNHGVIRGEIEARNVTVSGKVVGNIHASESTEITATGSVEGDVESSRISVVEGAYFKGSVDLRIDAAKPAPSYPVNFPQTVPEEVQAVSV